MGLVKLLNQDQKNASGGGWAQGEANRRQESRKPC